MRANLSIEYFFAPQSPWTYLGHDRLRRIADEAGAAIEVLPVDLGGQVFPVSGGLPLARRAPQRQAYRLVELKRFSEWLRVPLVMQPRYFPVPGDDAARLIVAVRERDGQAAAMRLSGRVLAAVWAEERDIANASTLAELLAECELPPRRLDESRQPDADVRYQADTRRAIARGVFGAPTYVVDGELFWGQDRLDFVQRRLAAARRGQG
jgi:2-hydroxychromene-2-carboxylate isomerase